MKIDESGILLSFDNQVAVVTGGAQGIGRCTAESLAERGYRLAIIDQHKPTVSRRAARIGGRGRNRGTHEGRSPEAPCRDHRRTKETSDVTCDHAEMVPLHSVA